MWLITRTRDGFEDVVDDVLEHAAVVHPQRLLDAAETQHKALVRWNDRLLEWLAIHVLPSMLMFDVALLLPLFVIPMADSLKITLGVFSGSWIQWWALPAIQRIGLRTQALADAKAEVDHKTLTYLATLQDQQMEILTAVKGLTTEMHARVVTNAS